MHLSIRLSNLLPIKIENPVFYFKKVFSIKDIYGLRLINFRWLILKIESDLNEILVTRFKNYLQLIIKADCRQNKEREEQGK